MFMPFLPTPGNTSQNARSHHPDAEQHRRLRRPNAVCQTQEKATLKLPHKSSHAITNGCLWTIVLQINNQGAYQEDK